MSVFGVLRNITIAAFVLLAILVVAANIKLPAGYRVLVVQSGSMEPAIGVGSLLLTKPTPDFLSPAPIAKFQQGDIITYSVGKNNYVSHRVVDVSEKDGQFYYQTKGDANKDPDQKLVADTAVVGKAIFSVPLAGRFPAFVKQPIGYFLMIVIPSLYVIVAESFTLWRELRRNKVKTSASGTSYLLPVVIALLAGFYLVGGTAAYFSDAENSTNNTFEAASSFANEPYADDVTAVVGTFGHCCGDLSSDPTVAKPLVTGPPDSPPDTDFIQISDNSSVTLKFVDNKALPTGNTDPDIRIHIYDTLFPANAEILVSQDCSNFTSLGIFPDTADIDLNIEVTGYSFVKCVKIIDQDAVGDPFPTLGFDLDAVEALNSGVD